MSILSRLFSRGGGGEAPLPEVEHNGYTIRPEPIRDGTQWRIAARIERVVAGKVRSHHLIRADTASDRDAAAAQSTAKARQMIDEQGEAIFDQRR